jgi:undecaprenyl-diphosphatase
VTILLLGGLNLVFLWYSPFDLSGDEAHYWDWSRRPAICYYSKGPMVAYAIWISTHLLGHTTFTVRLPAVLLSAATLVLLYIFTVRMFRSELAGLIAILLLAAAPMINVGGTLMTIDVLLCFFSVLAILCVWEAVERNRPAYWLLAGIAMAMGILSKFTGVMLVPGVFAFLLLSRPDRGVLKKPYPYMFVALALIAFLPVLYWNAAHNWVTFRHVAALGEGRVPHFLNPIFFLDFVATQLGLMSPLIFIILVVGLWLSLGRAWRGDRKHLFVQCIALPVILFYLLLSFHVRILPNWPVLGYLPAMVGVGAVIVEKIEAWRGLPRGRALQRRVVAGILLGVLLSVLGRFPAVLYAMKFPPASLPSSRLEGWRELGERVGQVVARMGGNDKVFIFCDSYQTTGETAFYTEGHPIAYCEPPINRRLNQYDFWPGCDKFIGKNAIYVGKMSAGQARYLKLAFESIKEDLPPFEVVRGGKVIRSLTIYKCYRFKGFPQAGGATTY